MPEPKKNQILEKATAFAIQIIRGLKKLPRSTENGVLIKQCIRSGTSIGANIEEATGASTRNEFIRCLTISRKEARETRYWLRLLITVNPTYKESLVILGTESDQIVKILNTIIRNSKANQVTENSV